MEEKYDESDVEFARQEGFVSALEWVLYSSMGEDDVRQMFEKEKYKLTDMFNSVNK